MTRLAIPYCGLPPAPDALWSSWNLDPWLLGPMIVAAGGLAILWRRCPARSRFYAALALGVLAIALVSPLCALSSSLFSVRTVHHILLVCAAAPLLALSIGPPARQGLGAVLAAALLQAIVLWVWHAPGAYETALSTDWVYGVMEITLLGAATLFWRAIRGASAPSAAFGLILTMVQMGVLGALLVFAGTAVYAPHLITTADWGLSPLEDQQLAGLIMWAPAAGVYLVTAIVMTGRWLGPDPAGRPAGGHGPAA